MPPDYFTFRKDKGSQGGAHDCKHYIKTLGDMVTHYTHDERSNLYVHDDVSLLKNVAVKKKKNRFHQSLLQ